MQIENLKVCSPDKLLRLQKSFTLDKEVHIVKPGFVNDINRYVALNALSLGMLLQLKTLIPDKSYAFDFEHQSVSYKKYDFKKDYKMAKGYFPAKGQY